MWNRRDVHLICRALQHHGHIVDHVLHNQQALRHAEAPEGRVGGQVGPAGRRPAAQVGDVVGVVHVKQNFLYNLQEDEMWHAVNVLFSLFIFFISLYPPWWIHRRRCQRCCSTESLPSGSFHHSWNQPGTEAQLNFFVSDRYRTSLITNNRFKITVISDSVESRWGCWPPTDWEVSSCKDVPCIFPGRDDVLRWSTCPHLAPEHSELHSSTWTNKSRYHHHHHQVLLLSVIFELPWRGDLLPRSHRGDTSHYSSF